MTAILDAALRRMLPRPSPRGTRTTDSRPVLPDDPRLILEPGAVRVTLDFLDGEGSSDDGADFGYSGASRAGLSRGSGTGGSGTGGTDTDPDLGLADLNDVTDAVPTAGTFLTATDQETGYHLRALALADLPAQAITDAIGMTIVNAVDGEIPILVPYQATIGTTRADVFGGSASVTITPSTGQIGAFGQITVTLAGVSDPPPTAISVVILLTRR